MREFDNTGIPDEYLRELGRLVVAWNQLESHLLYTLAIAVIKDWYGYEKAVAAFVHTSFPQKLDALGAMLKLIADDFADLYVNDVQGELKNAQRVRNAALHKFWYVYEGEVRRADVQARGKIKWEFTPVPLQELKDGVTAIEKANDCLFFISLPLGLHLLPHLGQ